MKRKEPTKKVTSKISAPSSEVVETTHRRPKGSAERGHHRLQERERQQKMDKNQSSNSNRSVKKPNSDKHNRGRSNEKKQITINSLADDILKEAYKNIKSLIQVMHLNEKLPERQACVNFLEAI